MPGSEHTISELLHQSVREDHPSIGLILQLPACIPDCSQASKIPQKGLSGGGGRQTVFFVGEIRPASRHISGIRYQVSGIRYDISDIGIRY